MIELVKGGFEELNTDSDGLERSINFRWNGVSWWYERGRCLPWSFRKAMV
jgi:hypothetical protein